MWRGAYVWDPAVILAQIVALQAGFYALLGALLAVLVGESVAFSCAPPRCLRRWRVMGRARCPSCGAADAWRQQNAPHRPRASIPRSPPPPLQAPTPATAASPTQNTPPSAATSQ